MHSQSFSERQTTQEKFLFTKKKMWVDTIFPRPEIEKGRQPNCGEAFEEGLMTSERTQ